MEESREPEKKNIPPAEDGSAPFDKGELRTSFNAWQLAWELGYTIAIPIVLLALVGRWADKAWGTSPWMLLAGVVVSIIISSVLVYRRVVLILKSQITNSKSQTNSNGQSPSSKNTEV